MKLKQSLSSLVNSLDLAFQANAAEPLRVEKADPQNYPEIRNVAKNWKKSAEERKERALEEDKNQFDACARMAKDILWVLNTAPTTTEELYLCLDQNNKIQGMAEIEIEDDCINIDFMTTSPQNIRSHLNINPTPGVGRKLMEKIEDLAKRLQKKITLNPFEHAVPFYTKCGYRLLEDEKMVKEISQSTNKLKKNCF